MLVSIVPGMASAKTTATDLSVYDVGPELRAQTPSMGLIDLSAGDSFSGGGSGAAAPSDFIIGESAIWMGLNDYTGYYEFISYTLRATSDSTEIWVADDLAWPSGDEREMPVVTDDKLAYLLNEMDTNILPTMTEYFCAPDYHDGSNSLLEAWGYADEGYYAGDKLIVLVDNVKDSNYYGESSTYIAGFYSPTFEAYFDRNIITIDCYDWANRIGPDAAKPYLYEGIIAHEFQHLLHDDVDPDEETFLNEGLADFAMVVCGYASAASHLDELQYKPENSLVAWGDQGDDEILADYGIAFLWTYYLWEQYGTDFIKAMFNDEMNGIESVESLLQERSKRLHFDDTFRDFSIAMLIDSGMAKYRYGFQTIDFNISLGTANAPNAEAFDTPGAPAWGTDYLLISGNALRSTKLVFDGIPYIQKDTAWTSDGAVLWGGEGDQADNWAIFEATGGGTLTFNTMYDIENYWDFGFVQVSTDNGASWTSLANGYTTDIYDSSAHPKVIANVPGLTGSSGGWVTMSFDLSAYADQQILVGFRYVTDWATSYGGWYIDDVQVDSNFVSDGTDASVFNDLTYYQPIDVEYSLTLVGFKQTAHGTQYKILTLRLNERTNDGVFAVQDVLSWSQKAVLLVTYEAEAGNVDYAEYKWTLEQNQHGRH